MSLKTVYPCFPPISRGVPSVLKFDPKRTSLIYANGLTVVIKNVADPTQVQIYTGHQYPVTAVAMAPSGCYMATGDSSGCLRIWACDTPDQILKGEYPMLAGAISDIDWSPDNSRIVLVGEGNPPAKVIMWDSGNSVGEISGHVKKINTCSYKSTRPFRVCTGSDDLKVNFYEGPPFKFKGTAKTHERYPNCVRYSPDGAKFFSVGSDMVLAVFDGKESTPIIEKKVHAGAIFSACWKADSTQILTCSADKTCKVLDAGTLDEVCSFTMGTKTEDQQMGCAFLADTMVAYSLSGAMSFLDAASPAAPTSIEYGHNTPIQALCYTEGKLFAGSYEDGAPRPPPPLRPTQPAPTPPHPCPAAAAPCVWQAPTRSRASRAHGTSPLGAPRAWASRARPPIASRTSPRAPTAWWWRRRTTRSPFAAAASTRRR